MRVTGVSKLFPSVGVSAPAKEEGPVQGGCLSVP